MSDAAEVQPQSIQIAMTFGRRVAIAAAVLLAARSVALVLQFANGAILAYRLAPYYESIVYVAWNFVVGCAVIASVLLVLLQAQRRITAGKPHWLASMPETRLVVLLVILLLISRVVPRLGWDQTMFDAGNAPGPMIGLVLRGVFFALAVAACYVWIWWCNCPPCAERLVLVAALSWAGFDLLMDLLDLAAPTVTLILSRDPGEGWTFPVPGSDTVAEVYLTSWIWRVGVENVMPAMGSWLASVAITTPIAAVIALVVYMILNRKDDAAPLQ